MTWALVSQCLHHLVGWAGPPWEQGEVVPATRPHPHSSNSQAGMTLGCRCVQLSAVRNLALLKVAVT